MTPYGLTTEQRTEPLGPGERQPRLSWKSRSDRRGAAQTAYRVTAEVLGRIVWDTGRRESDETGRSTFTATSY
jgi:alpha-L-rhamnosidase